MRLHEKRLLNVNTTTQGDYLPFQGQIWDGSFYCRSKPVSQMKQ